MREYDFTLKFALLGADLDPEQYIEKLYSSGCDDALIGIGKNGYIALNFTREASSAVEAVSSAVANVKKVIPQASLIEASPDLVGARDIAEIVGCSRQNISKMMTNSAPSSPPAIYNGSQAIWHLADVLEWLIKHKAYQNIDQSLIEVAKANIHLNTAQKSVRLDSKLQEDFKNLVGG